MPAIFDNVQVSGTVSCPSNAISAQTRATILQQESLAVFPIPLTSLRVWNAFDTNLPGTAASDDLGLVGGTFGTAPPTIQAGDLKAAGATTRYARFQAVMPECYVAGQTVTVAVSAGMLTTAADTTCTVDVEVYRADKIGGIGSDLCATAAQDINNTVFSTKSFSITASTLSAGDVLDVRIAIACNDGATGTAVIPTIAGLDLRCDIRG